MGEEAKRREEEVYPRRREAPAPELQGGRAGGWRLRKGRGNMVTQGIAVGCPCLRMAKVRSQFHNGKRVKPNPENDQIANISPFIAVLSEKPLGII
jgi:hypothetical protein